MNEEHHDGRRPDDDPARLQVKRGERQAALDLLKRLIERYGRLDVPGQRRTAALATCDLALILGQTGKVDEAVDRYTSVIESLAESRDPELRRFLARALAGKASLLSERDDFAARDTLCREIVERFGGMHEPDTAEFVAWARSVLEDYPAPPCRWWAPARLRRPARPPPR